MFWKGAVKIHMYTYTHPWSLKQIFHEILAKLQNFNKNALPELRAAFSDVFVEEFISLWKLPLAYSFKKWENEVNAQKMTSSKHICLFYSQSIVKINSLQQA